MAAKHRRPLIAGNWKMHKTMGESVALARAVASGVAEGDPEVCVCPPFTALAVTAEALKGGRVGVGAQNAHWEAQGAFTGEISAPMIRDAGGTYAILGHSERRQYFGENDATVRRRLKSVLDAALIPIVCIGERLEEREEQKTYRVLETQIKGALHGFAPTELSSLVIAYEPVWAIGTGKTATPAQAQDAHAFIRKQLESLYGKPLSASLRVLYGGSVKPDNIDALMAEPDLDGALVGGASLKAEDFLRLVHFKPGPAR